MKNEQMKELPSDLLEGMTSLSALLNSHLPDRRKIKKIWVEESKKVKKAPEIGFLIAKSHELGFAVEFVPEEQIESVTVGSTHGGIVAFCEPRVIPELSGDLIRENGFYVYLDGIEDPFNFGYSVRSLYAAGVDGIILPERNWMSAAGVVARSSAGASELIPMFTAEGVDAVSVFRQKGYRVLCAGIRDSVSIFEEEFRFPVLLVIGGEKRGISRKILDLADQIVRIDYGREFRGSLSAAAASAVLAFEIYRQNRK